MPARRANSTCMTSTPLVTATSGEEHDLRTLAIILQRLGQGPSLSGRRARLASFSAFKLGSPPMALLFTLQAVQFFFFVEMLLLVVVPCLCLFLSLALSLYMYLYIYIYIYVIQQSAIFKFFQTLVHRPSRGGTDL